MSKVVFALVALVIMNRFAVADDLSTLAHRLAPTTLNAELEHTSHASQHPPFTNQNTNYGYDAVSLVATWALTKRFSVAISEGTVLESCVNNSCGGLWGPREVFHARLSYNLWTK